MINNLGTMKKRCQSQTIIENGFTEIRPLNLNKGDY
jgi:hypothetical protein